MTSRNLIKIQQPLYSFLIKHSNVQYQRFLSHTRLLQVAMMLFLCNPAIELIKFTNIPFSILCHFYSHEMKFNGNTLNFAIKGFNPEGASTVKLYCCRKDWNGKNPKGFMFSSKQPRLRFQLVLDVLSGEFHEKDAIP